MRTEQGGEEDFLKSLGFPRLDVHETVKHFDFTRPGRRVLLIGPMGSGKTEHAASIWRDAQVALRKDGAIGEKTKTGGLDRRNIFFIRQNLDDASRFEDYPSDALPYRSGYVRCGENIAKIQDSFGLEEVIKDHPEVGTYIVDEASFFDERLAYVARNYSLQSGAMFVFPTLVLNFRREFFNSTARLILDMATDVMPFTAYCEHPECLSDAFYTYRYYSVGGLECPALYFDPLIAIGGDKLKEGDAEPNYQSRCDKHHYLPGKEYTFFTLKPLGEEARNGNPAPLRTELEALRSDVRHSRLYSSLLSSYGDDKDAERYMASVIPGHLAEKALCYLFAEQSLISEQLLAELCSDLALDSSYVEKTAADNRHPVSLSQLYLL